MQKYPPENTFFTTYNKNEKILEESGTEMKVRQQSPGKKFKRGNAPRNPYLSTPCRNSKPHN